MNLHLVSGLGALVILHLNPNQVQFRRFANWTADSLAQIIQCNPKFTYKANANYGVKLINVYHIKVRTDDTTILYWTCSAKYYFQVSTNYGAG